MVTKCARACIVSGALIGVTIPNTPPISQGHAKSPEVRSIEKTPQGGQKPRCPAIPVGQEFSTPLRLEDSRTVACADKPDESGQVSTLQRPRTPSSSRRRHLGSFAMTAYTQYHSPPRRTASGTMPAVGRTVAVDPRVIPLGTKLHIEGVGIRIAEDTGRKIKGKKLDLFLSSMGACTRFGVRARNVYLLD